MVVNSAVAVGLLFNPSYEAQQIPEPVVRSSGVDIGAGLRAMHAADQAEDWRTLTGYLDLVEQRATYFDALITAAATPTPVVIRAAEADPVDAIQEYAPVELAVPIDQSDVRGAFAQGWRDGGGREEWLAHVVGSVIPCESGWDVNSYNPAGPYQGLGQWLVSTWNSIASITGYADVYNAYHQGFNMGFKTSRDGGGEWGCW